MTSTNKRAAKTTKLTLLKYLLGLITALIVLLAVTLTWIYTTESGLQFVVKQVNAMFEPLPVIHDDSLPVSIQDSTQLYVHIGKTSGSLSSLTKLSSIQVETPQIALTLEGFSIQCHWLDLIRYKALCRSIDIKHVTFTQKSTALDQSETPKPFSSADIQQYLSLLNTDLKIDISSITIDQLSLNPTLINPIYAVDHINSIQVNSVRLQDSNLQIAMQAKVMLALKTLPGLKTTQSTELSSHVISASLLLQNGSQDQHQAQRQDHDIHLKILGPDASVDFQSSGSILDGSDLSLDIQKPVNIGLKGKWQFANDRFRFSQGQLGIKNLTVDVLDGMELNADTNFELNWPSINLEVQSQLKSTQYGAINTSGNISAKNLTLPLEQSQVKLNSQGLLTESAIERLEQVVQSELAQHAADLSLTKTLSFDERKIKFNIDAKTVQNKVHLDQVNIELGHNQLQVQGLLDSERWEAFQLSGKLQSKQLSLPSDIALSKADLDWQLNTLSQPIKIDIKGQVAQARYQQYHIEGLTIDSHIRQDIKSQIKVKKLSANTLLLRDLDWNVSGTLDRHNQHIKWLAPPANKLIHATDAEQKTLKASEQYSAKFNGQFIPSQNQPSADNNSWQYRISQLTAYGDLIKSQQPITVKQLLLSPSELEVQQACFNQQGKLCLQAQSHTNNPALAQSQTKDNNEVQHIQAAPGNSWQVQLDMQEFDFQFANQIVDSLQLKQAPYLYGKITGQLRVAAHENKITALVAKVDSPMLRVEKLDQSVQFEHLKITSKDIDPTHSVIEVSVDVIKLPNQMTFDKKRQQLKTANQFIDSLSSPIKSIAQIKPIAPINPAAPIGPIGFEHTKIKASFLHQPDQLNIEKLDFDSFVIARIDQKSDEAIRKALPNQQVKKHNPHSEFNGPLYHQAQITGSLNQKSQQIQHKVQFKYPPHVQGLLDGNLDLSKDTPKINSSAQVNLADMQFIQLFVPSIDAISGHYNQNLLIQGELDDPTITGDGNLVLDSLKIIELGVNISRSEFKTVMDQKQMALNGFVNTTLGTLNIDGLMQYQPKLSARLLVSGDKIQIVNNQNYLLVVSPNVNTTFSDNLLKSQGKVVIDQAKLTIRKIPKSANLPTDDEIIVSNKAPVQEKSALQFELDIEADIADKIVIDAMGLKASAKGKVRVQSQPNRLTRTTGKMELIDGEFEIYKQKLNITNGHLVFLGSAENPNIYFRAVRVIDEFKVGVIGEGSVVNPKLQLFSEPALPPEDIVSLIVTGRRVSSLSEKGGNMFTNSVISLGVEEADKIARKLGEQLGLKNIGVSSKTKADSTSIKLDSQINEKLSVGFGTVINSQQQTQTGWIIEYSLAPNLTLEAQSGDEVNTMLTYKKTFQSSSESQTKMPEKTAKDTSKETQDKPVKNKQHN
jgi:translocation and assembly module TamB